MIFWVSIIYALILFFHCILSKDLSFNKKLLWCSIILIFNVIGSLLYVLIVLYGKKRLSMAIIGVFIIISIFGTLYLHYYNMSNTGEILIKIIIKDINHTNVRIELPESQKNELKLKIEKLQSEFSNSKFNINRKNLIVESFILLDDYVEDGKLTTEEYNKWMEKTK